MSVFDLIRSKKKNTIASIKTTAGKVSRLSDQCPICGKIMTKAYSKGIPVLVCTDHNIAVPDVISNIKE